MDTKSNRQLTRISPLLAGKNAGIRSLVSVLMFVRSFISLFLFFSVTGFILVGSMLVAKALDKQQFEEDTKKVVFIAGSGSHGYGGHEYRAGCMLLARLLEEYTDNITTRVYTDGWPGDVNALEGSDAIIIFSDGGPGHMVIPYLESLNKIMERGVGLGVLHYALVVPDGKVGNYFLDWIGGYYETHWSINPFWIAQFDTIPRHEVTKGVNPFEIYDEWYYHMRFSDDTDNIHTILSALPPASTLIRQDGPHSNNPHVREAVLERGELQHVMWLYERTKMPGRGFGLTGGHYHWEWGHPDFRTLVLNAILWIAGAEIPAGGVPTSIITIEDLEANQDNDQPKDFNRDEMKKQLKEWQAGHNCETKGH